MGQQRHSRDCAVLRLGIELKWLRFRVGIRQLVEQRVIVRLGQVQRIINVVVIRQRVGKREWIELQRRWDWNILDLNPPVNRTKITSIVAGKLAGVML